MLTSLAADAARLLAVLGWIAMAAEAAAQPADIDPRATRILRASTDFLAASQRFSVESRSTIEVVLSSGQKLQFGSSASLLVQRPDRLRADREGDLDRQVFYYDGRMLTLSYPREGYYARIAVPPTLEGMLDVARDKLDIVAPAGDLIYRNAYEILMKDVTGAFVVGTGTVDGVKCHHLAFRTPQTDWQIWIEEGAQPLPRKMVITSTDVPGMPQFETVLQHWNLAPPVTPASFSFEPNQGSRAVEFVPATSR